jgi:hypothetical protein
VGAHVTNERLSWSKPLNEEMSPHPELDFFILVSRYCLLNLAIEIFMPSEHWFRSSPNKLSEFASDAFNAFVCLAGWSPASDVHVKKQQVVH